MNAWEIFLLLSAALCSIVVLVLVLVLQVHNLRAANRNRREIEYLIQKSRVDNNLLIRSVWREAQAVLLAEMEGGITRIEDHINTTDAEYKRWEVSVLRGYYNLSDYRRGGRTSKSDPQDGKELDK